MTGRRRLLRVAGIGGIALAASMAVGLTVGPFPVTPRQVVRALLDERASDPASVVVRRLRLPRVLLAALAGGGLAVAGAAFQALTRNPLADPSILGVTGGAAFAVVVAQILGLGATPFGYIGHSVFAFAGATAAAAMVFLIARAGAAFPIQTLLLAGVIVGLFFSASITLLISFVDFSRMGAILYWLMGSLGRVGGGPLAILAVGLAVTIGPLLARARALNLIAVGEESALHGGVEVERVKRAVFLLASLLTGAVVAFAGPIGFVGLIVPHAVRLFFGPDNRLVFPASLLAGGAFLVLADTLARTVVRPAELPVGVLTAFCGAPFFVYLLRRQRSALP